MNHIYIVGCGGVGSFLTPCICLLKNPQDVTVIDADILEAKNLNRQLFTQADIGKSKAQALAERYGCNFMDKWYSHGLMEVNDDDWLLVGVDNNPARAAVLESCDAFGCKAIFGANEVTSAEAYLYDRAWQGTKHDPRVYYPDILSDHSNDPSRAATGCTGEVQQANRQLVTANKMASSLMEWLFVLWAIEGRKVGSEARDHFKKRLNANLNSLTATS